MKVVLVHDYLNEAGGAERVLRVLSEMYPRAPIYTAFAKNGSARAMFRDRTVIESKWAWLLKIGKMYSYLRFLLPSIWRSFDLSKYELVITSSSGYIARGFKKGSKTKVVAYCHTPPKWLYGYETPTGAGKRWWGKAFMWLIGPYVRYFDYMSAQQVDKWIANSNEVKQRIAKFYRQEAMVIYPPIQLNTKYEMRNTKKKNDYYLLATRITGAKGVEEAIEGFDRAGVELRIVGEVVGNVEIKGLSKVKYLGRVSDEELARLYAEARGFVALARDEDFGMTVVEAMSYGTPALALNSGGYKETVVEGKTGIYIPNTKPSSIVAGLSQMNKHKWNEEEIKKWAAKFGRGRFEREVRKVCEY